MSLLRTSALVLLGLLVMTYSASRAAAPQPAEAQPSAGLPVRSSDQLIVHEWGTFTTLQDETGAQVRGINVDDEPVPHFVHQQQLVLPPGEMPLSMAKGIVGLHPDVVVRLETPVLYFYPPRDRPRLSLDVSVSFDGGWLTEYFPDAKVAGMSPVTGFRGFPPMTPKARGSLTWSGLQVGGSAEGPATDSHIWLAPRRVSAASVTTATGEIERYLFYRGVGNLPVPLTVRRAKEDAGKLVLTADQPLSTVVLVDVRDDGAVAFRNAGDVRPGADVTLPLSFSADDYQAAGVGRLRSALIPALIRDGLFEEEAEAMMNTWESAYFRQPGTRVFYLVSDAWTDRRLPLDIKEVGATENLRAKAPRIERAMIGRVELVMPVHRELLRTIAATRPQPSTWINEAWKEAQAAGAASAQYRTLVDINTGLKSFLKSEIRVPPEYRAYLKLGRFRNALVLDELKQRPTEQLRAFATTYGIRYAITQERAEAKPAEGQ